MKIKKVGVVGCGLMGSGIAQVCAQSDYSVVVLEKNEENLRRGLASIAQFLTGSVARGKLSPQDKEAILSRIQGTTGISSFADCDLVIEAVTENMDLKKKIFAELDKVCPKHTILTSNTSCLSITDLAMVTSKPDKVVGIHFFNPAPLMKLLEVVKTVITSEETLATAKAFSESLGKAIVVTVDRPGFITNRLLIPYLLDAVRMLEAGIASKEDIDTVIKLSLNHPMGPLTLIDLIGVDTVCFMANAIYDELKEPRFAAPTLLKKMATAGWLGRKTGKGFYEYS